LAVDCPVDLNFGPLNGRDSGVDLLEIVFDCLALAEGLFKAEAADVEVCVRVLAVLVTSR
jgi:hypothetical protein